MIDPTRFCVHPVNGRACDNTEPTHSGGQLGHDFRPPAAQGEPQRPQLAVVPDDPNQEPPRRGLILRPASMIRIRPVRWLWDTTPEGAPPTSHGRIPLYSLAIAAGGPGLGKSQFAIWMTARITRGELPGELYGKPHAVIYAAAEDSWTYTIAPRLVAAGADMDLVFHVAVRDDEHPYARLTLPIDTSLLAQEAERYSVALLVMDPLLSYIDKGINDYRAAEVRAALEPLVAAADRHHFTILGLAHFTKAGAANPLNRLAGSGAFGQLLRSLIAFAKEEDEEGDERFVMSLEKNNLGRLGLPSHEYKIAPVTIETEEGPSYVSRFVLGPETTISVRQVMRDETAVGGVDKSERTEAMEWLEDYMTARDRAGIAEPKEVYSAARVARITDNALREAKRRLRIKSVKQKGVRDGGWFWQMPGFAAPDDQQPEM
ncbi:AAA family ATPase [Streptomyces caeni]|uniref:AAA family ATPase n=1 Tax=Streptomyces caeni TaxID=2307231 RepID=A0ABW4IRI4_9ACTN